MAGAPSFGKMSTFISPIATIDASATEMTATRIVIGRRMAMSTNHMRSLLRGPASRLSHGYGESRRSASRRRKPDTTYGRSGSSRLLQKRREIAAHLCRSEQGSPHTKARDGIVGLGLCQQPLRFRHFVDTRQPILITRPRLALRGGRRLTFDRRVPGDFRGRRHERACFGVLRRERLNRPFVPRAFGELVLRLDALPRIDGKNVERRERERRANRPVRNLQPQTIAERRDAGSLCAGASSGERRLQSNVRIVRTIERALAGSNHVNGRLAGTDCRMRVEIGGWGRGR